MVHYLIRFCLERAMFCGFSQFSGKFATGMCLLGYMQGVKFWLILSSLFHPVLVSSENKEWS